MQEGSAPLNLYVEENFDRASSRGTGNVKTISNYAPVCLLTKNINQWICYVYKTLLQIAYGKRRSEGGKCCRFILPLIKKLIVNN